jgi:hypothetical protein
MILLLRYKGGKTYGIEKGRGQRGRASIRDFCSALAALVGPVQNIFFFTGFICRPYPQQARQAVVPRPLSLNMCLWLTHTLWQGWHMVWLNIFSPLILVLVSWAQPW